MDKIIVKGGTKLSGSVNIEGSKNAVLPIIIASLLASKGVSHLTNVPRFSDVNILIDLVTHLGGEVITKPNQLYINASTPLNCDAPFHLVSKMRASMLVMGPLLARYGYCNVAMPGGCAIGSRPIDFHIKGFEKMGVTFKTKDGNYEGTIDGRLKGANIYLDFPSVGATQNLIMGASLADGRTVIENVAKEPEIVDLANYINAMGGKVSGAGTSRITIDGVEALEGCTHHVIPDRIEAGTFLIAAAITKSEIRLNNAIYEHLTALISKLEEVGVDVIDDGDDLIVKPFKAYQPIKIKTMPHPGFPTDLQSQMMALLTTVEGTSTITETIFENRFMHVAEFNRMNASIEVLDNRAMITGGTNMKGAKVKATDLRAAASLILAGLVSDGYTEVTELTHLDRGYVNFHGKLRALGADIERMDTHTDMVKSRV